MSSEDTIAIDETEEPTKGQLLECVRGLQARVEKVEEENDELREENKQLRNKIKEVDQSNVSRSIMNQLLAALVNDKESIDFSADPFDNREVLEDFGRRVESTEVKTKQLESKVEQVYDGSVDGPEQAWYEIKQAANRLKKKRDHALPNNRVKLYKENIAQATGKSERHAGNYIEDFGEEKSGTDWQEYQRPSAANNNEATKKALIVDLDVWGDDDE